MGCGVGRGIHGSKLCQVTTDTGPPRAALLESLYCSRAHSAKPGACASRGGGSDPHVRPGWARTLQAGGQGPPSPGFTLVPRPRSGSGQW